MYEYVKKNKLGKGPITETAKAVKLCRQTVSKIINRGPKNPKTNGNKRRQFEKIDYATCEVIRREIYKFYQEGHSPTVQEILVRLQETCKFPYKETQLRLLLRKLGYKFGNLDKQRMDQVQKHLRKQNVSPSFSEVTETRMCDECAKLVSEHDDSDGADTSENEN